MDNTVDGEAVLFDADNSSGKKESSSSSFMRSNKDDATTVSFFAFEVMLVLYTPSVALLHAYRAITMIIVAQHPTRPRNTPQRQ